MSWNGLVLTDDGKRALNYAQISNNLKLKSVVIGDGEAPNNFGEQKQLVHQLFEITELNIEMTENGCEVIVDIPKVEYDYYFREVGLMVTTEEGDKLYVYDNCGDDAQFVVNTGDIESYQKRLRLSLVISDVGEIMVSTPSILYVAYDDFETLEEKYDVLNTAIGKKLEKTGDASNTTAAFTQAAALANITTGEKLSVLMGKIAKAIATLISHIATAASATVSGHVRVDAALSSTSANPVQNKVIKSAIDACNSTLTSLRTSYLNHEKNTSNPHKVTLNQIGAAKFDHTHWWLASHNSKLVCGYGGGATDGGYLRVYDASTSDWKVCDNKSSLGTSSGRWKQVYAANSTISTSDRNYKDNITPLTDRHIAFFMRLLPVSFTFKDGESGRTHIGMIAQDVEEAMSQCGFTDLDFAGFCKDVKCNIYINKEGEEISETVLDEEGSPVYIYSLRYEEFIGLMIHALQHTVHRVSSLEEEIAEIWNHLNGNKTETGVSEGSSL